MSSRVLLGTILVTALLSLVSAGLVIFPPAAPPPPEQLLSGLDPAQVTRLVLDTGTTLQSLERDDAGRWLLSWGQEDARASWPASDIRVRGGLRLLADATLSTAPATTVPERVPMIQIESTVGSVAIIRFGTTAAAGVAPVEVRHGASFRSGLTDERLHAVFAKSGMMPWRDERAMPGVARDPTRLLITAPAAGDARIELARAQGRWGLVSPVPERAEAGAVQSSFDALARVTILSFRDEADPSQIGLGSPRVSIEASGGRAHDAYRWRLDIGSAASADGNQVFVRLSGTLGQGVSVGPVYAVIGLDALSGVFTNPEAYLAKASLGTPAPDIRRFTIGTPDASRRWRYERTLDGWQITPPGAQAPRPATPVEAAAIPQALDLLATSQATSTSLREPDGFVAAAVLEVEGSAGLVAESVVLGRALAQTGASILVVRTGDVWRHHAEVPEYLASLLPVTP